jgi:hypothetical protein
MCGTKFDMKLRFPSYLIFVMLLVPESVKYLRHRNIFVSIDQFNFLRVISPAAKNFLLHFLYALSALVLSRVQSDLQVRTQAKTRRMEVSARYLFSCYYL